MKEASVAGVVVEFTSTVAGRAYGIIGTSVLPLFDSYARAGTVEFVTTRHEQAAVSAADAEGRVTGRPGIAVVHAGPGALNAALPVGIAYRDRAPLVMIVGGVRRRLRGTSAWLEVDLEHVFQPITKYYNVVRNPQSIVEALLEGLESTVSPPRGPAIIEVPEDLWKSRVRVDDKFVEKVSETLGLEAPEGNVEEFVNRTVELLQDARKPLILACGELAHDPGFRQDTLLSLAEKIGAYIVTSGNGRGACPEDHLRCLGRVGFGGGSIAADKALEESDLVIVFGNEYDDITTYAYTLLPEGDVIVASMDPDVEKRPRYYEHLKARPAAALEALSRAAPTAGNPEWDRRIHGLREEWKAILEDYKKKTGPAGPGAFFESLDASLPRSRIVTGGQGTHILYTYAFMRIYEPRSFLAATNLGAMSYALPAAIGAALASGRRTIAVVGDGDFMMTLQELETIARKRVPVGIVLVNDNAYKVLYLKQLIQYQGRVYETLLGNPDFRMLAESFGIPYLRVEDEDTMRRAVEALSAGEGPVLVELPVDPNDIPPVNLEATLRMNM